MIGTGWSRVAGGSNGVGDEVLLRFRLGGGELLVRFGTVMDELLIRFGQKGDEPLLCSFFSEMDYTIQINL